MTEPSQPEPVYVELAAGMERYGLWCDTCLTSARYEIDISVLSDDGVSPISCASGCARCDDCGA